MNEKSHKAVGSLVWTPIDPDRAVALEFADERIYHKARRLALELDKDDIRLPGRNTIILNKYLQSLFDEFENNYVEREVVGRNAVSSKELARLRADHLLGRLK